jgi:hypothetical protein
MVLMQREWAMPSADTFDVIPIHNFVRKYLHDSKVSIDPFARNKRWATYTNDLNPRTDAEFHMEAEEFLLEIKRRGIRPDLAIFDPPYSPRQIQECYESVGKGMEQSTAHTSAAWSRCRDIIAEMLTERAVVLSFGWNSTGMGKKHGFEICELLLVNHGACHNDTICVAERRAQSRLVFDHNNQEQTEGGEGPDLL